MKLTKNISEKQFDNNYWYTKDLKTFAKSLGITNSSKLRKDELEVLIKTYLRTGSVEDPQRKNTIQKGIKDYKLGLRLTLRIINYTNNEETKSFIEDEALKKYSGHKKKSGARYRLNRWREEQITNGNKITYNDLVNEYVRLNKTVEPFEKIPHGRYINFLADYLANEKDSNRKDAIEVWEELKQLDCPKNYTAWKSKKGNV